MKIEVRDYDTKSCLVQSKLPGTDYVINPYIGCKFGCLYCYASFMGRFVDEPISNWGNYVYAKVNIVEILEKELASWSHSRRTSSILMSSVTDPYQGAEAKYKLTRGILTVLEREKYPGSIGILTKSPLVLRDLDLIKALPNVNIGLTVTTTQDKTSRSLEVRAPLASSRIETLRKLNANGVRTYAFIGPLLPHFRYHPNLLEDVFKTVAETGVKEIFVEQMNLRKYISEKIILMLSEEMTNARDVYIEAAKEEHKQALEAMVEEYIKKYNLRIILGQVLDHHP